jgi:hypothetical protein
MGGLPSDINKLCFDVLPQCSIFGSNELLLAFFKNNKDLYPYYIDLPTHNSIRGRVELTISYLDSISPESNKYLMLTIFIKELKETCKKRDDLYQSLSNLSEEIASYITSTQNNGYSITEEVSNPQEFLYSHIENTRIIQIRVSQMFQMFDLLIYPKTKQGQEFFSSITDFNKFRRTLNTKREFPLSSYGSIQPIMNFAEKYKSFWKPVTSAFLQTNPTSFIPFTLDLTENLRKIQPEPGTFLESVCNKNTTEIENIQINGHLRVYPPGSGIITLNMTLTFRKSVYVELVAEIAHNIQDLLFIDSDGNKSPCSDFFINVINDLSKNIFFSEDLINRDRRWLPPETTFIFRDYSDISLEKHVSKLTLLMALSKGNKENWHELKSRIVQAVSSPHWQRDNMLGIAGENTSIILIKKNKKNIKKHKTKIEWFIQTREIITAAVYAQRACFEKLDEISGPRTLKLALLIGNKNEIDYIGKLINSTHGMMQAIYSLKFHIQKLGVGALVSFAKDLWMYDNPINIDEFNTSLDYISNWLCSIKFKTVRINKIVYSINEIKKIKSPFFQNEISLSKESKIQNIIENSLLIDLQLLRNLLDNDNADTIKINDLINEIENIHKLVL